MDATETRVITVFELITHNRVEAVLSFRYRDKPLDFALEDAQKILEPRLKDLDDKVTVLCAKYDLDELVSGLAEAQAFSGYIIGILAGLDLAKRPDLVAKVAEVYAATTTGNLDPLFEDPALLNRRAS